MAEISLNSLPLGFRFRPTDEELVDFYLRSKINGEHEAVQVIREIDVCKWEPWDLPDFSIVKSDDPEWFFFCPVDRKYPNGHRLNRATEGGYWKATGKDRKVLKSKLVIGQKKTLVFYIGRAPKGHRTHWVMHEYRPTLDELDGTKPGQTPYVLCRLFRKQDESTQVVFSEEETEHTVSPPITVQSSPDVTQSELAQGQKSPVNIVVPDIPLPVQYQSNCCNSSEGGRQISDLATFEQDQQLDEVLKWFTDSPPEPLDEELFPPVHSQLQTVMLSSCSYDPISNLRTGEEVDVQCSHNLKEPDTFVSEFVESLFNQSDDYLCVESSVGKNPAIQSELVEKMTSHDETHTSSQRDAKFAQGAVTYGTPTWDSNVSQEQRNVGSLKESCDPQRAAQISATNQLLTNQMNETDSGELVTTGIRIRARSPQDQLPVNAARQGNASRRIHLQCKFQIHPRRFDKNSSDGTFSSETKEVKEIESDPRSVTNAMYENHEPSVFETGRSNKFSHELGHQSGRNMRTQTGALELIRVPSVFSKTCPAHDPFWSVVLFSVVAVVVVLFVILVSSRRWLILEIAWGL
ncbi:hypothetical protein K2173_012611 [Erythroxylum novogranatense]|uniref:NAC domain-containing protein n=1 Tax=Erythroxylum novogranatense TaxID=1862640 RepID=A0AAV8S7J3_9ROSI|nr:hypothetical protein K2173_012611 [Erythroxylum novogranatense]